MQVLYELGCKGFNDVPEGGAIELGCFGDENILLEDGEALCKGFMAFGVFFHCAFLVEQLFNGREQVVVFNLVVLTKRLEELLVEEQEVGGFLRTRLDQDCLIP